MRWHYQPTLTIVFWMTGVHGYWTQQAVAKYCNVSGGISLDAPEWVINIANLALYVAFHVLTAAIIIAVRNAFVRKGRPHDRSINSGSFEHDRSASG